MTIFRAIISATRKDLREILARPDSLEASKIETDLRFAMVETGVLLPEHKDHNDTVYVIWETPGRTTMAGLDILLIGQQTADNSCLTPESASRVFLKTAVPRIKDRLKESIQKNLGGNILVDIVLWNEEGKYA